jgi:hypothetical protein
MPMLTCAIAEVIDRSKTHSTAIALRISPLVRPLAAQVRGHLDLRRD